MRTYFLLLYNLVRMLVLKLRHGVHFRASFVQRISPSARLGMFNGGNIILSYNLDLAQHIDIQAHGGATVRIG